MKPDAADNSVPREISSLLSKERVILRETQDAANSLQARSAFDQWGRLAAERSIAGQDIRRRVHTLTSAVRSFPEASSVRRTPSGTLERQEGKPVRKMQVAHFSAITWTLPSRRSLLAMPIPLSNPH